MRTTVRARKADCTGCGACVSVCPKNAIRMRQDEEGFLYPSVDGARCVGCDLCERRCPAGKGGALGVPEAFGAFHADSGVRRESSSGGVFDALAERTLASGGAVFGAVFGEAFAVEHVGAVSRGQMLPMRGSKYVQSDTADALPAAADLVRRGLPVLFSGTPCEVAGLYALLDGRRPENLLTVDFVCHGTPSPGVFCAYLRMLQARFGSPLVSYSFRDKRLGWKNFSVAARFEDGQEHTGTQTDEPYLLGFLRNLYLRPSCHDCTALRHGGHYADLTLADLWGAGQVCPERDDDAGLSLVLCNTARGKAAFEACGPLEHFAIGEVERLSLANPSLFAPAAPHPRRAAFFRAYRRYGFREEDVRRLLFPGRLSRALERIRRAPKAALRRAGRLFPRGR